MKEKQIMPPEFPPCRLDVQRGLFSFAPRLRVVETLDGFSIQKRKWFKWVKVGFSLSKNEAIQKCNDIYMTGKADNNQVIYSI